MSTSLISREELGRRISALRGYLQLTQEEFGAPVGAGRNTVRAWEKGKAGKPPLDQIEALCQHWFGQSALDLLGPDWDSRVWSKPKAKHAAA